MCPHHRKRTIAEIIDDLKNGKRIAAVTTQLVEAGVDLDFPAVYRAIAPLDAVIQAAGRCNRNGTMKKKGKVTLFDLVDHRMPDNTYRSCAGFAKGIIQDNAEVLHNADSFECYYEQVIELFVDPDRYRISEERGRFNFKTVNDQYRIIDDRTTPLLIANYSVESNTLLAETLQFFNAKGFIPKEQYRILQQYSVQVYPNFLSEFEAQIAFHESGLRIWYGSYDDDLGLTPADIETVF
jgi:CRISPR-associated endonuclease/helicase Cas3